MDNLATSLSPAFAAGFAVQRILELFDGVLSAVKNKKLVCNIISLVTGLALAKFGNLHVLASLSGSSNISLWIDVPVTGLIVSGGTEGLNSIMKFLSYKKEDQKVETADKKTNQTPAAKSATAAM
jgi:hypothetical protein